MRIDCSSVYPARPNRVVARPDTSMPGRQNSALFGYPATGRWRDRERNQAGTSAFRLLSAAAASLSRRQSVAASKEIRTREPTCISTGPSPRWRST